MRATGCAGVMEVRDEESITMGEMRIGDLRDVTATLFILLRVMP